MICIQKCTLFFLLTQVVVLCASEKVVNNETVISDKDYVLLSHLTKLIGYRAAKKMQGMHVRIKDIREKILQLPTDIQKIIAQYIGLAKICNNLYIKSFAKSKHMLTLPEAKLSIISTLSSYGEETIAIAQPESYIEIWSLKNRVQLFKSNQLASQANMFNGPLLLSSSPERNLYCWHIKNNYAHSFIPTAHTSNISFLFSGPNTVISCGIDGRINTHDLENLRVRGSISAHEGQIFTGKKVSEHTFITGGADSYVKEWDIRNQECVQNVCCEQNKFIPYGSYCIDDHHLILGGSQHNIYVLDRRKNLAPMYFLATTSQTFDLQALKDNTIVFGDDALQFAVWDGAELAVKRNISTPCCIQAMTVTSNDTITYACRSQEVRYCRPTAAPYHHHLSVSDIPFKTYMMVADLDENRNYSAV